MRVRSTPWRSNALRCASMLDHHRHGVRGIAQAVCVPIEGHRAMKLLAAAVPSLLALFLAAGAGAAIRPTVAPGQSWDAACEAAAPGDVIPLAAGSHPPQYVSCRKAAPVVTFRPVQGATVTVGASGRTDNCLSLGGSTHVTVEGVRTTTYTLSGKPGQCGVSLGRGDTHHVTLRNVDAGHIFVAANDVQILGG